MVADYAERWKVVLGFYDALLAQAIAMCQWRRSRDPSTAIDIVHDLLIAAVEREELNEGLSKPGYAAACIRNSLNGLTRRSRREVPLGSETVEDAVEDGEPEWEIREFLEMLLDAIAERSDYRDLCGVFLRQAEDNLPLSQACLGILPRSSANRKIKELRKEPFVKRMKEAWDEK